MACCDINLKVGGQIRAKQLFLQLLRNFCSTCVHSQLNYHECTDRTLSLRGSDGETARLSAFSEAEKMKSLTLRTPAFCLFVCLHVCLPVCLLLSILVFYLFTISCRCPSSILKCHHLPQTSSIILSSSSSPHSPLPASPYFLSSPHLLTNEIIYVL